MADLKVVELQPRAREVNPELVEALSGMIKKAEAGEMTGLAAAYMDHENRVTYVKGGIHSFGTIGALQLMSNQIERGMERV